MATILADRVQETTTTTGTGTLSLLGAVAQYQSFASGIGDGNTTYYALLDGNGVGWEVGIGVYTTSGSILTRATVLASSNGGSHITLSSNTHTVFCDVSASLATLLLSAITAAANGLVANSGTVSLGTITALSLMGNGQTIGAIPTGVAIGSGLSLSSNTLSATGTTGVTTIVAGSGLSGGTITSSGTISLGTVAAGDILGNSGTVGAVPIGVAIGVGLSLSSSTLTAEWQASPVTTIGSGLTNIGSTLAATNQLLLSGDSLLGNSGTITASASAIAIGTNLTLSGGTLSSGTLAAISAAFGAVNNSGTIEVDQNVTLIGTNSGTTTIAPGSGTTWVVVNMPTTAGTVTFAAAPTFIKQRTILDIVYGATVSTPSLNSGFVFTGGITAYTPGTIANTIDRFEIASPDGTHWVPLALSQGGTL